MIGSFTLPYPIPEEINVLVGRDRCPVVRY